MSVDKCPICGEAMPPVGQRYFYVVNCRQSKERFCSEWCAAAEREHYVAEVEAGLRSPEET